MLKGFSYAQGVFLGSEHLTIKKYLIIKIEKLCYEESKYKRHATIDQF